MSIPSELTGVPFIVEATIDGNLFTGIGFDLTMRDDALVWQSFDREHVITPSNTSSSTKGALTARISDGDEFLFRELSFGDGALAGLVDPSVPSSEVEERQSVEFLRDYLNGLRDGTLAVTQSVPGEDNLYVTRDEDGEPIALVKMSGAHPTLVRQGNAWRALTDDEDDLLGHSDIPVKEAAVQAWDSGEIPKLKDLFMDDRFSPQEITRVWFEVNDSEGLERLLIERSRDRFYERTRRGEWVPATPSDEATELDVIFSAIAAWDTGEIDTMRDASRFDAFGSEAA